MTNAAPPLLHGPYEPPDCQVGSKLTCAIRGRVEVAEFSDGPIRWPLTTLAAGGSKSFHVICGDLLRALRRERLAAIVSWWGVSLSTVARWRRALADPDYRDQLRRAYHAGPARSRVGTKHTPETRQRMSESHRRSWDERRANGEGWQSGWNALLGTMTDAALAARLGVHPGTVNRHRRALDIRPFGPNGVGRRAGMRDREWTAEDDARLGTRPDAAVAAELGCGESAVYCRRHKLKIAAFCRGRPRKDRQ